MTFTNPAFRARDASQAYVRAIVDLLGDRPPLAVLEELPAELERLAAGLPEGDLARPERPGKWSIRQVLQHLADSELVMGYRVRMVVTRDGVPLAGYDQDRWAERFGYQEVPTRDSLEEIRVLRARNLRMVRTIGTAELAHAGMHAERGLESVELLLKLWAGHDLVHRNQIERIRRTLSL